MAITTKKAPIDWVFDYFKLAGDAWPANAPTGSTVLVFDPATFMGVPYVTPDDGVTWIAESTNIVLDAVDLAAIQAQVAAILNVIVPAAPTVGSINDILSKASGGNTFVKATDSLEMLSDKLGAYSGDGGAVADDSVKAELDLVKTQTDKIADIHDTDLPAIKTQTQDIHDTMGTPLTAANIQTEATDAARDVFGGGATNYQRQAAKTSTSHLTSGDLFIYTGKISIVSIIGTVTTACEAGAQNCNLFVLPDALAETHICTVKDLTGLGVGTLLTITGTFADAMVATTLVGVAPMQATSIACNCIDHGHIGVTFSSGILDGVIVWDILWIPLSTGATLVAA